MNIRTNAPLRFRQIHLDFHTSEHIAGVGAAFDPDLFADTMVSAHINSVTIFAKCHHGWSYYPTKVGTPHPHLERADLMGDMLRALAARDIVAPIYITVQWDELSARRHPEWRALNARNSFSRARPEDPSSGKQLSAAWHALCLSHAGLRSYVLEQAREITRSYDTPGFFFDILLHNDCVCEACLERMRANGLDPQKPLDRLRNDQAVNETFRREVSAALRAEFPGLRIFFNSGHIPKGGTEAFSTYSHLELESLPTGGWGYDHFPLNARYAATLGLDFLAHTGKFHTSWGEFGGFKHPNALEYECAQMVALGSKCMIGDQLHPSGAINPDTYRSIAPAYGRVARLEPFAEKARQCSEIGIVSAEYYVSSHARNHPSDDGAVQMLLELHRFFDVLDPEADFDEYKLLILPDEIPPDPALIKKLAAYVAAGGAVLGSWHSLLGNDGQFALDFGVRREDEPIAFDPSYVRAGNELDPTLPTTPFVMYDTAETIVPTSADVLAEIYPPYFNRSYAHFSSHQHTPDDPVARPLGAAVAVNGRLAYVAYPIFRLYRAVGQPLYRALIRGLLARMLGEPMLATDLPTAGRASLTHQVRHNRYILHMLYGAPQIRGRALPEVDGTTRVMEMIEDIPSIGPVRASVRLPAPPSRVYDALTKQPVEWHVSDSGRVEVTIPYLHIHTALVFEG